MYFNSENSSPIPRSPTFQMRSTPLGGGILSIFIRGHPDPKLCHCIEITYTFWSIIFFLFRQIKAFWSSRPHDLLEINWHGLMPANCRTYWTRKLTTQKLWSSQEIQLQVGLHDRIQHITPTKLVLWGRERQEEEKLEVYFYNTDFDDCLLNIKICKWFQWT